MRVEGENDEGVIEPVTPCSELCANSIVEPIEIATITTTSRLSSFSPRLDSVKSRLSPISFSCYDKIKENLNKDRFE